MRAEVDGGGGVLHAGGEEVGVGGVDEGAGGGFGIGLGLGGWRRGWVVVVVVVVVVGLLAGVLVSEIGLLVRVSEFGA